MLGAARAQPPLRHKAEGGSLGSREVVYRGGILGLPGEGEIEDGRGLSQPFITSPQQLSPLRGVGTGL